jgi:hypothetical protein
LRDDRSCGLRQDRRGGERNQTGASVPTFCRFEKGPNVAYFHSPARAIRLEGRSVAEVIGAGLQSVAVPAVVARLLNGAGRINFGEGAALTVQGVGASLSRAVGGWIAQFTGYHGAIAAMFWLMSAADVRMYRAQFGARPTAVCLVSKGNHRTGWVRSERELSARSVLRHRSRSSRRS